MGISRKLILEESIAEMIANRVISRAGYGWVSREVMVRIMILGYESLPMVSKHVEVVAAFCGHGSVERGGGKESCWNTRLEGWWSVCEVPGIEGPFCTCIYKQDKA